MPKRTALVLSGGGAKGEFQLGFLMALAEKPPQQLDREFCFFTGVSVGALNATILAQHAALASGVAALTRVWDSIRKNDHVYETPLGEKVGMVAALFTERGIARDAIHKPTPLHRLIGGHVSWGDLAKARAEGRTWGIGVTSLIDGRYYLISNWDLLVDEGLKKYGGRLGLHLRQHEYGSIPDHVEGFVLASASMPLFFPPVDLYGHRFVDGGVRDVTPLSAAFLAATLPSSPAKALQLDEILVINASPKDPTYRTADDLDSGREIVARSIELMVNEITINDIEVAKAMNAMARKKNIAVVDIWPKRDYGLGALEFSSFEKRQVLRQEGYETGKAFDP